MLMASSLVRGRADPIGIQWDSYRPMAEKRLRPGVEQRGDEPSVERAVDALVGVVVRPLRPVDVIRPFELNGSGPSLGERRLHHHALQMRAGEAHGDVADLAALVRIPAQTALVAGADDVLDIRVRAGLAELVVEGRDDVLPGLVERDDAVVALGVDPDGV